MTVAEFAKEGGADQLLIGMYPYSRFELYRGANKTKRE